MKGDKVMKFINNKLYINYSELSPEQKSIYLVGCQRGGNENERD